LDEAQGLLAEHVQAFKIGVFLALFSTMIAWRSGFFHLPKRQEEDVRLPLTSLIGAFFLFLFITILVAPVLGIAFLSLLKGEVVDAESLSQVSQSWINIFTIFLAAISLTLYLYLLNPKLRRTVWNSNAFISFVRTVKDLMMGILTWSVSYPVVLVVGQLLSIIVLLNFPGPTHEQIAVKNIRLLESSPLLFWIMALSIVTVVPIIEEVLFRGFLQTWIRQRIGVVWAILFTSLVFSTFHYSSTQGANNVEVLGSLFVLSCFLGFIYERQRSLWASIGLHAFFNTVSVLLITIQ